MKTMIKTMMVFPLVCLLSILPCLVSAKTPATVTAKSPTQPFAHRKEVQAFVKHMHQKHGLEEEYLLSLFQAFGSDPKVLALISKPYEALPWYKYRDHVVTPVRVKEGVAFLKKNREMLKKAEKEYGVPAEIIVAIIGVESNYGQIKGKFPIIQSLSTLSFDFPRRAQFFKGELEQFLLLTREEKFNAKEVLGSYAGAMGIPQFMPSNYRRYAVDFTGSGQRDLMNNMGDVIGSIANYFRVHGWIPGGEVIHKANVNGTLHKPLLKAKNIKPDLTLKELAKYNVTPQQPNAFTGSEKLKLLGFEKSKGVIEPMLAHNNFYAITRYNHSTHYAMAVYLLSQKIRASL